MQEHHDQKAHKLTAGTLLLLREIHPILHLPPALSGESFERNEFRRRYRTTGEHAIV
jgi:hypothetical protein